MNEERLMQSMLLDFYGELLTEKQRRCYDLHFNEDLSLSEIAEECGISRQGVWDNIRRADAVLKETEDKTGLIRRFSEMRDTINAMLPLVDKIVDLSNGPVLDAAKELRLRISELRSQE